MFARKMSNQTFAIFLALVCTLSIKGIISASVHEKIINSSSKEITQKEDLNLKSHKQAVENLNYENAHVKRHIQSGNDKGNDSRYTSIHGNISQATYFPPSNGRLMHDIRVKVKNEANFTKNCAIKVWRENTTQPLDSPVTIECEEIRRKRNNDERKSEKLDPPVRLSTEDDDVKKFAKIGVRKYAEIMVNSSGSNLQEITEAHSYPEGNKLLYKIKIHMAKCNQKESENCQQMQCIVYVWRDTVLDRPVSIECDPIKRKRNIRKIEDLSLQSTDDNGVAKNGLKRSRNKRRNRLVGTDEPVKMNVDDPLVKKYAQMAIDKYGSPNLPEMRAIIKDIAEATAFPPPSNLLYEIKLKVGSTKCRKDSDERNCEYNPETGFNECEIKIFKESIEPSITMICFGVGGRRRRSDDQVQISDLSK